MPTMPFCRSITTSAGFASSTLMVIGSRSILVIDDAAEQAQRKRKLRLFLRRKLALDRAQQPVLPRGAAGAEHLAAGRRQGQDGLPAIFGIRRSLDEAEFFQSRDGRAHRLRAHA